MIFELLQLFAISLGFGIILGVLVGILWLVLAFILEEICFENEEKAKFIINLFLAIAWLLVLTAVMLWHIQEEQEHFVHVYNLLKWAY